MGKLLKVFPFLFSHQIMFMKNLIVNKPILEQIVSKKKQDISLNITRYTTDANGSILDDAAIPTSLKKPFPFHLFGEFDFNGSYQIADRVCSQKYNTNLLTIYIPGTNTPLFFPNPLATINNVLQKGDVVFTYVDDPANPLYFIFVVLNCQNGAWASIVKQLNTTQLDKNRWGTFKVFDVQYQWLADTRNQITQPVYTILTEWDADYLANSITPSTYYKPEFKPGVNELIIPVNIVANQYVGLSSFITYLNPSLTLSFIIYV